MSNPTELAAWLAKYPRGSRTNRVVAECHCDWEKCEGWVWTYPHTEPTAADPFPLEPSPWERILDPQPFGVGSNLTGGR